MGQAKIQLEMVHYGGTAPFDLAVPDGYLLRQYQEPDRASYWRLFAEVFTTHSRLDNLHTAAIEGGFHVVENEETDDVVASAVAAEYAREGHDELGSLQWVMTDPAHTGRGLGKAVVAAATTTLAEAEYRRVYLSTDDWRLPAIHVYLELGWRPLIFAPDMEGRWSAVLKMLGRNPADSGFVVEPR